MVGGGGLVGRGNRLGVGFRGAVKRAIEDFGAIIVL